jgi:hypothetical protein
MHRVGQTLALGALCALLFACTASRVNPKADIDLSGTVQRQGGLPVAGARLALTREGDPGDVILTVASVGFACLEGTQAPAICHNARFVSTASNGAFSYKLKGKDTQSTFGYSAVLSLTSSLPAKADEVAGSSTTYRFHVQTEILGIPIRLWEPSLAARTGSFGARVSVPRLPTDLLPRQLDRTPPQYTIEFARGDEIVWRLSEARPVTVFDPRLLEDSTGTMRVIASASNVRVSERLGDQIAFALRSGARAYESPLSPPVSRGKGCSVVDERGKSYPVAPCRLTDGDFGRGFSPAVCSGASGCTEPRYASAVIDLGAAVGADLIVLRGCQEVCRVDTSTDGRTWRSAGVAQDAEAAFSLASPRHARYVRVVTSFVDSLTEVSVWSGRPRVPNTSLLVAPGRFPTASGSSRAPFASSPARSRGFAWLVVVASILLGAVAGAAALVIARRRTRGAA